MILDLQNRKIEGSKSIISFETTGSDTWKIWDRYLCVEGKKAYHIGNICGTCAFFFERMDGANQSINPEKVINSLNAGIEQLDDELLQKLQEIFPDGEYVVLLSKINPTLARPGDKNDYFAHEEIDTWGLDGFWGMPHFPKTEYYRLATETLSDNRFLFEFLIPMFPGNWLKNDRVGEYSTSLEKGQTPTAVSLSVLDVKQYFDSPDKHLCLAHYLIDGHHKVYAAAKSNQSLTLISFLAVDKGVSSRDDIDHLLRDMRTRAG